MQGRNNKILDFIAFGLTVPKCISCRARLLSNERALCSSCMEKYREIKRRNCPRCAKVYYECSCTPDYLSRHFIKGFAKVYKYRHTEAFAPANAVIYRLKKRSREDAVDFMAEEIVSSIKKALPPLDKNTLITNVPNRKAAIREYGFDHAAELAKAVAEKLYLEYKPLLISLSKRPQKEMSGNERISNATFDLITDIDLRGNDVIIIDDIVTTGASVGNSAAMIRALRPRNIYAACIGFAGSYEDPKKT